MTTAENRSLIPPLSRRLLAEFLGTALLVTVVVGSGIAAQQLSTDAGLQLLENSGATVFGLTVLILMFGPVSGAHFNPVVTLVDWLLARRAGLSALPVTDVAAYAAAQVAGAIAGSLLANVMFDVSTAVSSHHRASGGHLVGEVVATAGLIILIFSLTRSERGAFAAPAVGAYIGAAYWFTSSTSFANPAVTIGRVFTNTFAGIAPASVGGFVLMQLVGAAVGFGIVVALYPDVDVHAEEAVIPHHASQSTP